MLEVAEVNDEFEKFTEVMKENFGFDEKVSKIIYEIASKTSSEEFFSIMGGFVMVDKKKVALNFIENILNKNNEYIEYHEITEEEWKIINNYKEKSLLNYNMYN